MCLTLSGEWMEHGGEGVNGGNGRNLWELVLVCIIKKNSLFSLKIKQNLDILFLCLEK